MAYVSISNVQRLLLLLQMKLCNVHVNNVGKQCKIAKISVIFNKGKLIQTHKRGGEKLLSFF